MTSFRHRTAVIARRVLPATVLAAAAALSFGAYTGYAAMSGRKHSSFNVVVTSGQDTIGAGSTAGYRLTIRRRHFPWAISLKVLRPLPTGATVHFSPAAHTRASRSTLTIATQASTPPGVYNLTLRAKHGRVSKKITLKLTVAAASSGDPGGAVVIPRFTIAGNAAAPLEPGMPEGIDLQFTNPNPTPVIVNSLSAGLQGVSAPNATGSLPCSLSDFAMSSYTGALPLTIPASSTRTLSQLGVPAAEWPQVTLLNLPVNQDGCEGATVTFAYTGGATLG